MLRVGIIFLDILDIKVQTPSLQEAKRKPLLF